MKLGLDKLTGNPLDAISKKSGAPPGTISFVEAPKVDHVSLYLLDYDESALREVELPDLAELSKYKKSDSVTWLNIVGSGDVELLKKLGEIFELHPLVLEDIGNTAHMPKLDDYEDYLFVIARSLRYDAEVEEVTTEQVSVIVGPNYVITFQEHDFHLFAGVKSRIASGKGRIRKRGSDYLAYALLDALVDHYLVVLENIGNDLEDMQTRLIAHPQKEMLQDIYQARQEVLAVRKAIFPLREIIMTLRREDTSLMSLETRPFLDDILDHMVLAIQSVDDFRENLRGMLELYHSSLSNQMNDVMKVLTVISTIFIPLTFIAGIYGMNFNYMPELAWHWGYFTTVGVMILLGLLMFLYFKKQTWF